MENLFNFQSADNEMRQFFTEPNAYRSLLLLVASIIFAYWLSRFLAKAIIKAAKIVASRSDNETNEERAMRLRQIETYLSVVVAAVRAIIVSIVGYLVWDFLSPVSDSSVAAIGASAFFVVFAGQSLGMVLRDVTTGAAIIIEKWFNVGDFIKIEPFMGVSGVVERLTLRSTRLRSLSGEIIWVHNQQIQAVHVTPRGVRTIAVDVFVRDRDKGEQVITDTLNTVPVGPTMLATPLRIKSVERWGDTLWRITIIGQTPPGREWLMENFYLSVLKDIDEESTPKSQRLIVHDPIARYADAETERRFKRAVRIARDK